MNTWLLLHFVPLLFVLALYVFLAIFIGLSLIGRGGHHQAGSASEHARLGTDDHPNCWTCTSTFYFQLEQEPEVPLPQAHLH